MDTGMSRKLAAALDARASQPGDQCAIELAYRYAAIIDETPELVCKIGPLLLSVLEALGLTPRARALILRGGVHDQPSRPAANPLDELRARRAQRAG